MGLLIISRPIASALSLLRALRLCASVFPSLFQSSPGPSAHCHQKAPTPSLTWCPKKTTLSWCHTQSWRMSNPSSLAARIITLLITRGWSSLILRPESTATRHPTSPLLPRLRRCQRVQLRFYRKGLSMLRLLLLWHMRSRDLKKTG